jgi:HAD superfamily hydrolase (TIGR01509 family)
MIRAILFDMDGVLVDAKEWHYIAFNRALEKYGFPAIAEDEHLAIYDGLPTKTKLELLQRKNPSIMEFAQNIYREKQDITSHVAEEKCRPLETHVNALSALKKEGYKMAVCSNSISATITQLMALSQLTEYFDFMLSNEDVPMPKPDPGIYRLAMQRLHVSPAETLVLEDNAHGIDAAKAAGAHILVINEVADVTIDNIRRAIAAINASTSNTPLQLSSV